MKQLNIFGWHEHKDAQPAYLENMAAHCQFVRTTTQGDQPRNDLGDCIIQTSFPYLVFKIRRFQTSSSNFDRTEKAKEALVAFLQERDFAYSNAFNAGVVDGISVQEYVNGTADLHYDEEFDEHRMVSKVPGYNLYLEWYGSLLREFTPDFQRVADIMQRATAYMVCTFTTHDREQCHDYQGQPLLCSDWDEEQDIDWKQEKARSIPYRGIGKESEKMDFNRREPTRRREKISSEEAAEHEARQIMRDLP